VVGKNTLFRTILTADNELRLKILYLLEEERSFVGRDLADILSMTVPVISHRRENSKTATLLKPGRKAKNGLLFSLMAVNEQISRILILVFLILFFLSIILR
jgi:hypothetical protein